jgi:formate dehydrogenase subunit gamma
VTDRFDRFDVVTRSVHWLTAVLLGLLLLTGTVLYVGQLSAAVGRRALLVNIHLVSGLLLIVPLVLGVALPRHGARLRADLNDLNHWTRDDRRWLRKRTRAEPVGKFNGGQKLVTAVFGGLFVMQLLTGALMHWNGPFSDEWRTGATFVHDWAYLGLVALVVGHVMKAVQHPDLLTAMWRGAPPSAPDG